jgi:hypothetical protein
MGAYTGPEGSHQWIGVFVYLLPFLEGSAVSDQVTRTLNIGVETFDDNYWEDVNAWTAGQTSIGVLLCPSIPGNAPDGVIFDQVYGEISGPDYNLYAEGWDPGVGLGLTHYQAVAGIYGKLGPQYFFRMGPNNDRLNNDKYLVGVYTTRSKISAGRIVDGMSKLLAFGEAPGTIGSGIQDQGGSYGDYGHGIAWIGTATLPTLFGLDCSEEDGTPNAGAHYETHWAYFGSLHAGNIVQFVYVDGSVHSLPKSIDTNVLDSLSTIQGGETADVSQH